MEQHRNRFEDVLAFLLRYKEYKGGGEKKIGGNGGEREVGKGDGKLHNIDRENRMMIKYIVLKNRKIVNKFQLYRNILNKI